MDTIWSVLQDTSAGVNCAPSEELCLQTSVHAQASESPACQTGLPLSDGFLPRLCCLGPCLQLQPGPAFPDIATSTTRPPERPGAACRARTPGGDAPAHPREMLLPIPVPPGTKPCTWRVRTPDLGREQHYLWFSLGFFSWVYKVFHHLFDNSWMSVVWMSGSWIPLNDLWFPLVPAEREQFG